MSTRRQRKRWSRKKRSRGGSLLASRGGDRRTEHHVRKPGKALRLGSTAGLAAIQDAKDERAELERRMARRRADAVRRHRQAREDERERAIEG